ncbi:hypothetical protein ABMD20_07065 [Weissella confusa]|uniref:hypothetical protein n=1 Tax=Weissella confusa TaxID=1583 RepID=UPI00396F3FA2
MSKHLSGFQELLILLATVIVWPIIWSVMTGDNIWSNYPWGVVATVAASFLYLTKLNEVLLTLLVYLAWLIAIILFKDDLIFLNSLFLPFWQGL